MKLLCVSDKIDPFIYTDSIRENFADADMILCAGDLQKDYLEFISGELNKPLLFVDGNDHTDFIIKNSYSGISNIDNKVHKVKGLIIAGLGGCMRRQENPSRELCAKNEFTDFQMYLRIFKLLPTLFLNRLFHGRFVDILLTHACPLGIHDKEDTYYLGFKSFLFFMKFFKPKYLVHGHVHLYDTSQARTTQYLDTLVINAYGYYVIDTGEKHNER